MKLVDHGGRAEVQGLALGDEVVLHLNDGTKLVVENGAGTDSQIVFSLTSKQRDIYIPVYGGDGELVCFISTARRRADGNND